MSQAQGRAAWGEEMKDFMEWILGIIAVIAVIALMIAILPWILIPIFEYLAWVVEVFQ
jgi:hypothetical protein